MNNKNIDHYFFISKALDDRPVFRIAPSPTGDLQAGNGYIFFWTQVFVKQLNGDLILRLDDTDIKRNIQVSEIKIINILKKMNIEYAVCIKQSERLNFYKFFIKEMLNKNFLFFCNCPTEQIDICECELKSNITQGVLKLKNAIFEPYNDLVFGNYFNSQLNKNLILVRSDNTPVYHLTSSIDDYLTNISYIIRSMEWLSYSIIHQSLFKIFNKIFNTNYSPKFVHLPLLLDITGKKLSKRNESLSLESLLHKGFLIESLKNYFLYISCNINKEFFNEQDIDITKIRKTSPKFDFKKLCWYNREYMKKYIPFKILFNYFTNYLNDYFPMFIKIELINLEKFLLYNLTRINFFFDLIANLQFIMLNDQDLIKEINMKYSNEQINLFILEIDKLLNNQIERLSSEGIKFFRFFCFGNENGCSLNEILEIYDINILKIRLSCLLRKNG